MVSLEASSVGVREALRTRITAGCGRDLSKAFVSWLLRTPEERSGFATIAAVAGKRDRANQDFQTIAILGFAADAGLLSSTETVSLQKGLRRLAGGAPAINGVPLGFPSDPVWSKNSKHL